MNWYISKLVFQIICGEGHHSPQFDEQLRIIRAEKCTDAYHKALEIGRSEEDTFINDSLKLVQWKFINVAELYLLGDTVDGAEIYSRIEETNNAENYCQLINDKAQRLRMRLESQLHETF